MKEIIQKDIPGYEGHYQATTDGKIWSIKSNMFLSARKDKHGYYKVTLRKPGERKDFLVHRLIALTFIPNPENKPTVDHIDINPLNNNVENLRWASIYEQNHNRKEENFVHHTHAVECRDLEDHSKLIATYSTSCEAAEKLFDDRSKNSLINRCAQGKVTKAYGYFWTFVGEYNE